MKMRTIIEAGRKASPVVNTCIDELKRQIDEFGQILSDFSAVKSECGRAAMLVQCSDGLGKLSSSLDDAYKAWSGFESVLRDYKYQFGRCKKTVIVDVPGQQVMDFALAQ